MERLDFQAFRLMLVAVTAGQSSFLRSPNTLVPRPINCQCATPRTLSIISESDVPVNTNKYE